MLNSVTPARGPRDAPAGAGYSELQRRRATAQPHCAMEARLRALLSNITQTSPTACWWVASSCLTSGVLARVARRRLTPCPLPSPHAAARGLAGCVVVRTQPHCTVMQPHRGTAEPRPSHTSCSARKVRAHGSLPAPPHLSHDTCSSPSRSPLRFHSPRRTLLARSVALTRGVGGPAASTWRCRSDKLNAEYRFPTSHRDHFLQDPACASQRRFARPGHSSWRHRSSQRERTQD